MVHRVDIPAVITALTGFCLLQFHAMVLAAFASIIAPFGGFFASGFKRGFKIKDFGDSIPGHGGMTDRMDCQVSECLHAVLFNAAIITIPTVPSAVNHNRSW